MGPTRGIATRDSYRRPPKPMTSRYRAAAFVCGAGVLSFLVFAIGPTAVLGSFRALSWRLLVVIVFPTVLLKAFDVLAWRFAFPHERVPLGRLATTLLAGQAIASTPASLLGGNAFMAWRLRERVKLREVVSSLVLVQTTSTASQGVFLLLGVVIARHTFPLSMTLVRAMEWLLVLELIGVLGFVVVQMRGAFAGGYGVLKRLGLGDHAGMDLAAADVDEALADVYRRRRGRLGLSLLCNFLGWIMRAAETWLILYFLHAAVTAATALVIEAFGTGISFATFFVPIDLGVEESGAVAAFLALGLSATTGLSFALVRRIREVAWTALGLLLLAAQPKPARAVVGVQTT